jgi:hypothetical protein
MLFLKFVFFKKINFKNYKKKFKFQTFKNGKHQVSPNCNFPEIFCLLAFKGEAVGVAQISAYAGGGGGT